MKNIKIIIAIIFILAFAIIYFFMIQSRSVPVIKPTKSKQKIIKPTATILPLKSIDFRQFTSIAERKKAFINFLTPIIDKENQKIIKDRRRIISLQKSWNIKEQDKKWLNNIAKLYRVKKINIDDKLGFAELLNKVDVIPRELGLAQAAIESAWGVSRFCREGNNFFGQWCFSPGCGIIPKQRPPSATFEVAVFKTPTHAIEQYMLNLNTNKAYEKLRFIRAKSRNDYRKIKGRLLANGLGKYSAKGEKYIAQVIELIDKKEF